MQRNQKIVCLESYFLNRFSYSDHFRLYQSLYDCFAETRNHGICFSGFYCRFIQDH